MSENPNVDQLIKSHSKTWQWRDKFIFYREALQPHNPLWRNLDDGTLPTALKVADAERFPLNPLLNLENLEDNNTLVWPGKTEMDWRRLISKLSWLFDCSFINCHVVHAVFKPHHLQLINVRTVNFFSAEVLLNPWVINNIFQSSKSMVVSHSST